VDYDDCTWEKAHVIKKIIPNLLIQWSMMRFCRFDGPNDIELFSMLTDVTLYEFEVERDLFGR
jgi:hypothetical protein